MAEQLPLPGIVVEVAPAPPPPPPKPLAFFIVAAWHSGWHYWKFWAANSNIFTDRAEAERFAAQQSLVWTNRHIVSGSLPAPQEPKS